MTIIPSDFNLRIIYLEQRARNDPGKLVKIAAGSYLMCINGKLWEINRNDERDTSWYGQWIARTGWTEYTDPMPLLSDLVYSLRQE